VIKEEVVRHGLSRTTAVSSVVGSAGLEFILSTGRVSGDTIRSDGKLTVATSAALSRRSTHSAGGTAISL
jgi:hypothetical protein